MNKKLLIVLLAIIVVIFSGCFFIISHRKIASENSASVVLGTTVAPTPCGSNGLRPNIAVTPISAIAVNTPVAGNNNDTAVFTIKFSIKAIGCDAYIAIKPSVTSQFYIPHAGGTFDGTYSYPDNPALAGNIYPNSYYKIPRGQQENFTSTFPINLAVASAYASGPAQYRAFLNQIKWDTTNRVSPTYTYTTGLGTSQNTTPFSTNWVNMN